MDPAHERFSSMRLVEQYDTQVPKDHGVIGVPFLMKRTKVIEIVTAQDIVFALAQSGACAAFSRKTNKRICFLNVTADEVIRSLFYNKCNDSLITVSVYASDNFSSLKCRSTRLEYILRGQTDAGFALFESESLKWPGFVEFDDVNGKVVTYSAEARNHNVSAWNFCGELVTSFEDLRIWNPDCNTSNICIPKYQDLIISYCKEETAGSINISDIRTGKCLAKINASDGSPKEEEGSSGLGNHEQRKSVVAKALEDITALFYDEERNEIYTGNRDGFLHVWSN